mmetsp:Transcript_23157/g.33949  ORF Transcript_23157/g.33949 Transcript_23157/m.33949 type:complete len:90 (+) Transcript_23157:1148-1417(+)
MQLTLLRESGENFAALMKAGLKLARVYVRVSRGNLLMSAYMCVIATDISSQLDWKLNRTVLIKQSPVEAGYSFSYSRSIFICLVCSLKF